MRSHHELTVIECIVAVGAAGGVAVRAIVSAVGKVLRRRPPEGG